MPVDSNAVAGTRRPASQVRLPSRRSRFRECDGIRDVPHKWAASGNPGSQFDASRRHTHRAAANRLGQDRDRDHARVPLTGTDHGHRCTDRRLGVRLRAAFPEPLAERNPAVRSGDLAFAWTGETDAAQRQRFRELLVSGRVPLLVTSPESMSGALLQTLRAAATGGRIAALVIDEAHLVTQWGRDFRPEFRQLSALRRDLLDRSKAAGHEGLRTLLFSATLGPAETRRLGRPVRQSRAHRPGGCECAPPRT